MRKATLLIGVFVAVALVTQIRQAESACVATSVPGYVEELIAMGLSGPHNLAFDKTGNLYVANEGYTASTSGLPGTTISRIAPDGQVSTFADGFVGPAGIAFDKEGNLWVGDDGHTYDDGVVYNIWKIAPDGTITPGLATVFANPNTLAFDKHGNLFVVATGGEIWKVDPSGTMSHFAGGFSCPQAIDFDKKGNVYTCNADGTIWKLDPSGSTRTQYAEIDGNYGNFAFDKDDNLYAPDCAGKVVVISPSGQIKTSVTGLSWSRGVAFDSKGNLYITDYNMDTVWRVSEAKTRTLFIDKFEETGLERWTTVSGTWAVQNGELTQADQSGGPWYERPAIIADCSVEDDFVIETKFRHETIPAGPSNGGSVAILFRYQDMANTLFVIFHYWPNGGTNVIVGKVVNGIEYNNWYDFPYGLGAEYSAVIEVQGAKIDLYVDGALVVSNDAWGSAFSSGKIGFDTWCATAAFDDLVVSQLRTTRPVIPELKVKWAFNTTAQFPGNTFGAGFQGCQTVWDVDGDGTNEIVFGTRRGQSKRLWCISDTGQLEWIYPPIDQNGLPGDPTSKVSLVDVNKDGTYELCLAGRGGRLHVLDGYGHIVWTWDNPNSGATMHGAPQAFDVDGDTFVEFFLEDGAGYVHRVSHDGQLVWTSFQCGKANEGHPTLADIDRDGSYEVLWASQDHNLYCIDANTGGEEWRFDTGRNMQTNQVIVADVNKDGWYEAIVWTDSVGDVPGTVLCVSFFGAEIWRWALPTVGNIRICQAIGDVDGDGRMDMVVNADPGEYVLEIGGATPNVKWAMSVADLAAKGLLPAGAVCNAWSSYQLIADIDGDDNLEILWMLPYPIVTDAATGALEAYYLNEHVAYPSSPREENGGWWGDVDNDGKSEWIVELNGKTYAETQIYCLTMNGKFPAKSAWPEYYHCAYPARYQQQQKWLTLKSAYSNSLWFPIEPKTPSEAINDLIVAVEGMNLEGGIENSLDSKLQNAMQALDAANAWNRQDAVNKLEAFINEVEAQRGKKLTDEQADFLIAKAQEIIDHI